MKSDIPLAPHAYGVLETFGLQSPKSLSRSFENFSLLSIQFSRSAEGLGKARAVGDPVRHVWLGVRAFAAGVYTGACLVIAWALS